MPTVSPATRPPALDAQVFWFKYHKEIVAFLLLVVLGIIGMAGYWFYSERRGATAAALLASAKNAQDFQQVIARYPNTAAGASASLLLAQSQRNERNFDAANATLQQFVDRHPNHELVSTAQMAMAANFESMGKTDEALSIYQKVTLREAPPPEETIVDTLKNLFKKEKPTEKNFNAALAMMSQVPLLKAKKQPDAARRVCETLVTQFPGTVWAMEATRELRSLRPSQPSTPSAQSFPLSPGAAAPSVRVPMAFPSAPPQPANPPKPKP
jgi:predicted negative regulator of RcsB-dependent stress response